MHVPNNSVLLYVFNHAAIFKALLRPVSVRHFPFQVFQVCAVAKR